jgi:hypothetical protein
MVGRVVPLSAPEQTVVAAAAAFLAQPSLARSHPSLLLPPSPG